MKKLLIFLCLLTAPLLRAQVPQLVNYQGRVAVGNPAVNFDGAGSFKFALVNSTGTTTFWSNDGTSSAGSQPTAAVALTVTKGLYSVLLGDTALANMTAIPGSAWTNADVRLRVWFNDGTNGFQLLTPDQRLAPNSYLADGAVTAAVLANGAVTTTKIGNGAVGSTQLAGNAVTGAAIAPGAVGNINLANPSLTVTGGTGLSGGGVVSLGGNITLTNSGVLSLAGGGGISVSAGAGAVTLGSNATSSNVPSTIVTRDISGSFTAGNIAATFNGNGAAVTNLNASNISTGTLPDGRLSANVALRAGGNAFSGNQTISGGRLGLGTAAPLTALHIAGTGDTEISVESTDPSGRRWTMQSSGTSSNLGKFQFIDRTAAASRMTIDPAGNVGIGTTAPGTRLQVNGDATVTGLSFQGSGTGTSEPPDRGLITRRVVSSNSAAGQIVARSQTLTLERDGTDSVFLVRFQASLAQNIVAALGIKRFGGAVSFYDARSPITDGVLILWPSSDEIVYFRVQFGTVFGQTTVEMSRFPGTSFWAGTLTSTLNQ